MSRPAAVEAETVSTAELLVASETNLNEHFGNCRHISALKRRPCPSSSSFAIELLELCFDDQTTLELVFKNLGQKALLREACGVKPLFLYDPLREIEIYQKILRGKFHGSAAHYGATVDHRLERYWLFLEKVPGVELYQVGDFLIWQRVAHSLAILHNSFTQRLDLLCQSTHLLRYDDAFYRLFLRRAQTFLAEASPSLRNGMRKSLDWLAERYEKVIEFLVALPATLIHGEFYPSNVLVDTVGGLRVCPIDWEMAGVGPGLIDLAALVAGKWTETEKEALALSYQAAMAPETSLSAQDLLKALDYCRLHVAVQWLGWSQHWSPPPEHTQNWFSEAMRLADKLKL